MEGHFAIQGDAGYITVAAGAKAGIVSRWNIRRSGTNPDGSPRLRFKAQFSFVNETLLNMNIKKRVVVQMRSKLGYESIDIVEWDEWRLDGGVLTLENITGFDTIQHARAGK